MQNNQSKNATPKKSTRARPETPGTGVGAENVRAAEEPHDNTCRACPCVETQLHLCECDVIRREYWSVLLDVLRDTGMPPPENVTAFIATGALSESHAISRFHASVWFLGWRCLYAAVVNSRVDAKPLDLDAARGVNADREAQSLRRQVAHVGQPRPPPTQTARDPQEGAKAQAAHADERGGVRNTPRPPRCRS